MTASDQDADPAAIAAYVSGGMHASLIDFGQSVFESPVVFAHPVQEDAVTWRFSCLLRSGVRIQVRVSAEPPRQAQAAEGGGG